MTLLLTIQYLITMIKSIFAGIMIGLGGLIYLSVDNKYIGAFLFSMGLLTILYKGYHLYTGRIYSLKPTKEDILEKIRILLGNFVGAFIIMGGLIRFSARFDTANLWNSKLSNNWYTVLVMSILCGILMYIAVSLFNDTRNPLLVVMPIMIFILSGCEHCIANAFYLAIATNISSKMIVYVLVNILGNTIGSVLWYRLEKTISKL